MIRVRKRNEAPAKLAEGTALVEEHNKAIDDRPGIAGSERETFKFKKAIYGHKSVKDALKEDQCHKCCYCEGYFAGHASGDVEHYRPKAYSLQTTGGRRVYPGYYWLAYSWSNLYYSCEICNRVRKRNLFPLRNPAHRARGPGDRLEDEDPLMLDPGGALNPRDHIRFIDMVPHGITDIGKRTIEVLGLNRNELIRARLTAWKLLVSLDRVARWPDHVVVTDELREARRDAQAELKELIKPESEYSAMAQDFLDARDQ